MRLRLKQQRLIDFLATSGLSQNHWALKLGISKGHWSEIVNGKHPYPSARTRQRMLEVLHLPVDELFDVETGMAPFADSDFRRALADRYLIDTDIGQGGMGAVYLARDVRHGRPVAVKVISLEAVSGVGIDRFQREIATIAHLQHPHILPFFDSGEAAGHPFYVMPWIRGGSLRSRLETALRLPVAEAVRLATGIAAALHYGHGHQVLHCDVKPENVLLDHEHPYVMDFGIARTLHSEADEWPRGGGLDESAGTPAYVSPEQAAGEKDLDARSDVYSLGCMVFEMLAGRPPFEGTTTQAIVASRFVHPPPPIRDFAPDVPAAVQAVVEQAMSVPRERRQDTAGQFARELAQAARRASGMVTTIAVTASRGVGAIRRGMRQRPAQGLGPLFEGLRDLARAWRGLRRSPGFTVLVALTLGLALGANATMFGIVDRILLRAPTGIQRPGEVHRVLVSRWFDRYTTPVPAMSYPAFTDLRDRTQAFAAVAASDEITMSMGAGEGARLLEVSAVSADYFRLLETTPAMGRFFDATEDALPLGSAVAVLGHDFWQREFGGDAAAIEKTLPLGNRVYDIVGIAPRGFTGTELGRVDVWIPLSGATTTRSPPGAEWWTRRGSQFLRVFARIKPGVPAADASEDARRAYAEGHADSRPYEARAIASLAPIIAARDPNNAAAEGRVALWLFAMAGVVLLIACANVANLVLARGLTRRGEIAVRRALGVSQGRLLRQFATESAMLALLGAAVGLVVARWGGGILRTLLLPGMAWDSAPVNGRVLALTGAATLFAAVIAGLIPLVRGSRADPALALRGVARGTVGSHRRALGTLLVVQMTLSTLLLIGAGLFVRSLDRVRTLDLGFSRDRLLRVRVHLPTATMTTDAVTAVYRGAMDRVRTIPGVVGAGLSLGAPFMTNYATALRIPGRDSLPRLPGGGPYFFRVSDGTLEALNVRLRRGRLFTERDDRPGAEPVVIITERMASTLWPGRDPLGECVILDDESCTTIVGVVDDLHRQGLVEEPFYLLFIPLGPASAEVAPQFLLIRSDGPPEDLAEDVRRNLASWRSDLPFVAIEPFEALIAPQANSWRLGATMFTAFGVLSLLIASIGVYGVLAFAVTQRGPELGIRAALGATPAALLRMIVTGGAVAAGIGVVLGTAAALAASSRLEPLLFDTSPRDPAVLATGALTILALGLIAGLVPGFRAARSDPSRALRSE